LNQRFAILAQPDTITAVTALSVLESTWLLEFISAEIPIWLVVFNRPSRTIEGAVYRESFF